MGMPTKRRGLRENLAGSELFIYDGTGEELSVLNASALFVWSLCDGAHDVTRMGEILSEIYPDVPLPVLRDDIETCLRTFQQKGLIVDA